MSQTDLLPGCTSHIPDLCWALGRTSNVSFCAIIFVEENVASRLSENPLENVVLHYLMIAVEIHPSSSVLSDLTTHSTHSMPLSVFVQIFLLSSSTDSILQVLVSYDVYIC